MPDSAPLWILWSLTVIAALFVGGFLKSYMGKKGENLATHEEIQKLVDQTQPNRVRQCLVRSSLVETKLKMDCCRLSLVFRRLGKTRHRLLAPLTVWRPDSSGLPWSA
jgi:hypothetical protein